jgi:hypothetical protein
MAYQTFFYDRQLRRFVAQVIRLLSNFQVQYSDGTLYRVPVTYGDSSRQAQAIISRNSENSMPSAPMISVYINGLTYDRSRVQDPTFVDKGSIRTRKYDPVTDSYLPQQGNAYSIERVMPVPYELAVKCDIWTANSDQKFQLLEQMLSLFNPALEIQSTDNYLDWTSLSYIEQSGINWSSRSIPQGTDDSIDIATIDFKMPIWLSSPARVTKMGVIERVIASVFDPADLSEFIGSDLLLGTRQCITFQNYAIWVNDGQIQLLKTNIVNTVPTDTDIQFQVVVGETNSWPAALEKYGVVRSGISQLRLITNFETGTEIVGTITVDPSNDKILLFSVDTDTIPTNTLDPVSAIINPQKVAPGLNGLPAAQVGQRYLLIKPIGSAADSESAPAWNFNSTETVADVNDIIEYTGTQWTVVFDSSAAVTPQYVSNLTSGKQYKYADSHWVKSYEGEYDPLNWRLIL